VERSGKQHSVNRRIANWQPAHVTSDPDCRLRRHIDQIERDDVRMAEMPNSPSATGPDIDDDRSHPRFAQTTECRGGSLNGLDPTLPQLRFSEFRILATSSIGPPFDNPQGAI
jgi:hypothetical protein